MHLKRFILICVCILGTVFSLKVNAQGHSIDIKLKGTTDQQVVVGYHFGKQRLLHDTVSVDTQGMIRIAGEDSLPAGVYFLYTPSFYFEFLVSEQSFQLALDVKDPYKSMTTSNSRENELFRNFQLQMGDYQRQQRSIIDSLSFTSGQDSLALREKYMQLVSEMNATRQSMVESNEGTFFSDFIALMSGIQVPGMDSIADEGDRKVAQFEYYRAHYMELVPDPQLLMRTPVIHEYVMKYFNDLVIPQADSTIKAVDDYLGRLEDRPIAFRYWLVTLFNHYQESKIMGMDAITVHLSENYYLTGKADWVTEESKEEIRKEIRFIKPNLIGRTAPDMRLVDTLLSPFKVQTINTPFLVLYFYDPDCGVCRKKTPVLKEAYEDLKSQGAEVLAISTISEMDKWKDYIKKNDLNWFNAGDPQGRSNFRVDYNVRSTPKVYVLGPDRTIIAKNLDVSQLLGFIQDYKLMHDL